MALKQKKCEHIEQVKELVPSKAYVCDECIKTGSQWVHLRTCQTCGTTLCCDSSPNKHATNHFKQTTHPIVISAEPGEKWMWCYEDKLFYRY